MNRVRRAVKVTLVGTVVADGHNLPSIEPARGEQQLYRTLANTPQTPRAVARAASQWGPLARISPLVALIGPAATHVMRGEFDDLVTSAERWSDGSTAEASAPLFEAIGQVIDGLLEQTHHQLVGYLEFDAADVLALQQELDQPAQASASGLLAEGVRALRAVRERQPSGARLPRWAVLLDAAGDLDAQRESLGELLDQFATAGTPEELGSAARELQRWGANLQRELPTELKIEPARLLDPLFAALDGVVGDGSVRLLSERSRSVDQNTVAAVISRLQVLERSAVLGASSLVPPLASVETWRSLLVLVAVLLPPASPAWAALGRLVKPEHAAAWYQLVAECAAWRNAIDAQRQWEYGANDGRTMALRAWQALRRALLATMPIEANSSVEVANPEDLRYQLLDLVTLRCCIAGVDPRPQALVGTEGRALWSIRDALATSEEPRICAWLAGCAQLLPPGSYAHRQYCDSHRLEANRRRAADWRKRRGSPRT